MLTSKTKINKIINFSFLFLVLFGIFLPFKTTLAADQTIKLERFACNLNGSTDKWSWSFKITTTNIPDNTKIYGYLFQGTTAVPPNQTSIVKTNYAQYLTGSVLDPGTTYGVNVIVAGIPKLAIAYTETTPAEGVKTCGSPQSPIIITNTPTPAVSTKTTYTPLAPLPGVGTPGCVDAKGKPCIDTQYNKDTNPCPFGNYLNIMIKIFLGLCAVLAVIMIVWGGIQYMTSELVSSKEEGKKSIINAILGLLLALGAFVILNTLNPNLLNICLNNLPTATITIDPQQIVSDVTTPPTSGAVCNNEYKLGDVWPLRPDEPNTIAQLVVNHISVNNPMSCEHVGDKCTSVYKLDTAGVIKLKQNCDKYLKGSCDIQITGGTECWMHTSNAKLIHMPGGNIVDLHKSTSLVNYVTQNGTNQPQMVKWIGGKLYPMYIVDGMKLVDEAETTHYHVFSY